jgi:hypothetical protein
MLMRGEALARADTSGDPESRAAVLRILRMLQTRSVLASAHDDLASQPDHDLKP